MTRTISKHCYLIFYLLLPSLLQAQQVFVKAYDPLVYGAVMESTSDKLIVAGTTDGGNIGTDFAVLVVDTAGEVLQSFSYDYGDIDELKFIRQLGAGNSFLFGGHSWSWSAAGVSQNPDSAKIVIGRVNASLNTVYVKEFDFGANHRGGVLTGLEQTNDGGVVFTVLLNARSTIQQLVVVKLDRSGMIERQRVFNHVHNLNHPIPSNNLVVKQNGDLVISRHLLDVNGNHYGELIGLRDSLLPNNGYIKWRTNYEVSAIHALAIHPSNDSLSVFFQAGNGTSYGVAKADPEGDIIWGAEEIGSLIALAPPKRVRLKMRGDFILTMVDNRVTYWTKPGVKPIGLSNPYHGVMTDFETLQGKVYLGASILLGDARRSILVKSTASDQTGNCFTYFLNNARFLSLNPIKRANAITIGLVNLAINTQDSSVNRLNLVMEDTVLCVGIGDVWPGDANSDGNANNRDALYVGLGFDLAGPARTDRDSVWKALASVNWYSTPNGSLALSMNNGADYKHSDCNGDGLIDRKDLRPILKNYSQMHGKQGLNPCDDPTAIFPPLYLEAENDTVEVGDTLRVWVFAGDPTSPVDSLYGISFDLGYDMMLLDTLGVNFRPVNSWLARRDSLLWLEQDFFMQGETEIALSKAEPGSGGIKVNSHGHGKIAYFDIFTIDDIIHKKEFAYEDLRLDIKDVFALTLSETQVCFDIHADTVVLFQKKDSTTAIDPEIITNEVSLHPNPAQDWIDLHTPALANQEIVLYDVTGRILMQWYRSGPHHQLSLMGLKPGFYYLTGYADGKQWTKKMVKK